MSLTPQPGPLYPSRSFLFDPNDPRGNTVTLEFEVQGEWTMFSPVGNTKAIPQVMPAGTYRLVFIRKSPQPLVRVTIDPDPGGGRVP